MPRIARLIAPEYPHHITQRGNYRQDIFKNDTDRRHYLNLVAEYSRKFNVAILAYCLMNNHVHFIITPHDKDSLSEIFRNVHTRYSQYFNKKLKTTGHLWQGRYYSCILDECHLLAAARYIERNPVRAGIIKKPTDYIWSSARNHAAISNNDIINADSIFQYIEIGQNQWKDFVDKVDKPDEVLAIRKYTMTGRPLGSIAFVQRLEQEFGEILHALPVGRPKKIQNKK